MIPLRGRKHGGGGAGAAATATASAPGSSCGSSRGFEEAKEEGQRGWTDKCGGLVGRKTPCKDTPAAAAARPAQRQGLPQQPQPPQPPQEGEPERQRPQPNAVALRCVGACGCGCGGWIPAYLSFCLVCLSVCLPLVRKRRADGSHHHQLTHTPRPTHPHTRLPAAAGPARARARPAPAAMAARSVVPLGRWVERASERASEWCVCVDGVEAEASVCVCVSFLPGGHVDHGRLGAELRGLASSLAWRGAARGR